MCGIVDDLLPVLGGIAGTFVAPGIGTAIGAGLGSAAGNYAQTHNFGSALESGALGGGLTFAGGALGNYLGGLGSEAGQGFSTAAQGADTLGSLESTSGGAGLYGPAAGTGTAIGSQAANAMGAGGVGIAGGSALQGVGTGLGYMAGLGGSTAGTGLGLGGQSASGADLNSIMSSGGGPSGITGGVSPTAGLGNATSPVAGASGTAPTMGANPVGALSNSGGGVAGSPMPFDQTGGAQFTDAASQAAAPQGSLSSMYGPTSVAGGSPQGALISQAGNEVNPGVQFGAMGAGTPASVASTEPLTLQSALQSPMGRQALAGLFKTGVGAYQNFQQQAAARNYADSIKSMFSTNSPYAQQMQQTLARQDAAAGRNSQYGTRSVQLAAALAQAQANALGGNNYAAAAQNRAGTNALNNVFANFATPQQQQGLAQLGTGAFNSLASLWS